MIHQFHRFRALSRDYSGWAPCIPALVLARYLDQIAPAPRRYTLTAPTKGDV